MYQIKSNRIFFPQLLFLLLRIAALTTPAVCGKYHNNNNDKQPQRFAMEPQDQTAIVGSRVTLPCRVTNKSGLIQWTKDDFGLGVHRNLSGFDRYSMVGSDEEGDFSLDIYPVMLDDDAKYQCQVSPGKDGTPGIRSRFASLTILVSPDNPKIIHGNHMSTTEGKMIELECISYGGKPAAEITWIDGTGTVLTEGITYTKELIENTKRFTAKSKLKLIPRKEHHNMTFTCQAQNTADRTYKSAKMKLEVKYTPKVKVSVIGQKLAGGRIPEGAEVRLSCHAEANPGDLTYKWFINGEEPPGDYDTEMLIPNVSRNFHNSVVKCVVQNSVGRSDDSKTLDISYGPVFRSKPKSAEADVGNQVTLSCDVDGNPPPEIVWIFDPTERVVGSSPNLTLTVTPESAGRYYCKASVNGFPEIGAEATIYIKGPPSITSSKRQTGINRDTTNLECVAFSIPKPRHLIWYFNGKEINASNDENFSIMEDQLPHGIKSVLVIRDTESKHFGKYNCSVVNDYGHDNVEIELISQNSSQIFIYLFFGFLMVFIIICLFIGVICCSNTRRKLPPADVIPEHHITEKGMKETDRYSNNSDMKHDRDHDYSETYSATDSTATRLANYISGSNGGSNHGVPLAGPVKIPNDQRYSGDYTDMMQTKIGLTNNGYIPYSSDYSRDYSPPQGITQNRNSTSLKNHLLATSATSAAAVSPSITTSNTPYMNGQVPIDHYSLGRRQELRQDNGLPSIPLSTMPNGLLNQSLLNNVDPRYSATYGNPYLKQNNSLPYVPTANPAVTPAPPPYNRSNNSNSSFSSSTTISNNGSLLNAGVNVGVNYGNSNPNVLGLSVTTTAPPTTTTTNTSTTQITSPSRQFIVPANGDIKKGALATHV